MHVGSIQLSLLVILRTVKKIYIYSFVKHKKTDHHGVAPLKSEGKMYTNLVDKATTLNKQFESVFSKSKPDVLHISMN